MKISVNSTCPCGSGNKYKKCCQVFHKGANAKNALELMRSRYCAYKLHLAKYIIKTTHKQNVDYKSNTLEWEEEILDFCHSCSFEKLEIKEYIDGSVEAFVTFRATTLCDTKDYSFTEKSKFKKEFNKWYYFSGCFLDNL